mgnify:CR=1 FL=1
MQTPAGYQWLIENQSLPALPRASACYIDSSVRGRNEHEQGGQTRYRFSPQYAPDDNWISHLQFALRYESVDLTVLALLFRAVDGKPLCQWLEDYPNSAYARRACFFYEWLTDAELPMQSPVSPKTRYINALDPKMQYCAREGTPSRRFRVTDNLPGTPAFCPLVRRTPALQAMEQKDLKTRVQATLAHYDADLLRRAAAYLYLKETQSSFEVEREKPSASKAERFADLLRQADTRSPLTEERLTELQNAVIDPRFHEFTWRHQQNWIGKDMGYRQLVDFVPARPEDLPSLMQGLLNLADSILTSLVAIVGVIATGIGCYGHHVAIRLLDVDVPIRELGLTSIPLAIHVAVFVFETAEPGGTTPAQFQPDEINRGIVLERDFKVLPDTGNDINDAVVISKKIREIKADHCVRTIIPGAVVDRSQVG